MPKTLDDNRIFDDVDVPVGTDPALASSVETPFQLLTDRTWFLWELVKAYVSSAYLNLSAALITLVSTFDFTNVIKN